MRVKHVLQMTATCPVNGRRDRYTITVECERVIRVEDILTAVEGHSPRAAYQEEITQALANELGAKVTSVGFHSGVRTEVVAE